MGAHGSSWRETFGSGEPTLPGRVLIVSGDQTRRERFGRSISQVDLSCDSCESGASAIRLLNDLADIQAPADLGGDVFMPFHVAVVDMQGCNAATLKLIRDLGARHVASIVLSPRISFDQAVSVMKAGALDILSAEISEAELSRRVKQAVERRQFAMGKRVGKATKIVRPKDVSAVATGDVTRQEFQKLMNNELDVEALLRHSLEFVLAKVGPTNAAVFLPGSTGDYALGAYVNFSCPKDTAEMMLDHLANIAAPALEQTIGVLDLTDAQKMRGYLGEGAEWLAGKRVLAFSCRQEGECLAVFVLFREEHQNWPEGTTEILSMIREEFGEQLARVIRIHHRHLPRDKWGAVGDGLDIRGEDDDLAA